MTSPDLAGGSDDAAIVRAPAGGGFGDDTVWRRLSPRSMIVRPLTDLVRLLPLVAGLLILHTRTGGGLVWGIAAAAVAIITGLVHWATTRYLITDERVYLRRGLLNQKTLSVARDRIRTVDITAHLLHRVLGVCRISIGTGRNDLRSSENFHLDGVTRFEAESLRIDLLPGFHAAGVAPAAVAPEVPETDVAHDEVDDAGPAAVPSPVAAEAA